MQKVIPERWENQQRAYDYAMSRLNCMLDMDMGTGKTRVAIDVAINRRNVCKILVVCPKAVVSVWRQNLEKFAPEDGYTVWDTTKGSIADKAKKLREWLKLPSPKKFVVINYDAVWRGEMGDIILDAQFHMVILDESHRAKSPGSKVSKFLYRLGRCTLYKMCLSGTPMSNSPLDVYGQYRFLDPSIFGTNYNNFLQTYAILGGPERRFVVGYKNQHILRDRFNSIAFSCKMSEVADRLMLPSILPPNIINVSIPASNRKIMDKLSQEFIAECSTGHIVVSNVLTKMLRLQQITSGFCVTTDGINTSTEELNDAKRDVLEELMGNIGPDERIVVFCVFRHDLKTIADATRRNGRSYYELSGSENTLEFWKSERGSVLGVQIKAGSEGVDMTLSRYAIYMSLPHSLATYEQSKARLYRPGQKEQVSFTYLLAEDSIDESMYRSLVSKKDIIESIKNGDFDFGYKRK